MALIEQHVAFKFAGGVEWQNGLEGRTLHVMKRNDLTGRTFGQLTVLGYAGTVGARATWRCGCACGGSVVVRGTNLLSGNSTSCGCTHRRAGQDHPNTKHGQAGTALYLVWGNMHTRCYNPKNKAFAHYGARGVSVCQRWASFENFIADMGPRPAGYTLERVDVNGNYTPDNCVWASWHTQQRNRTNTKIPLDKVPVVLAALHGGLSQRQAADKFGVSRGAIQAVWRLR